MIELGLPTPMRYSPFGSTIHMYRTQPRKIVVIAPAMLTSGSPKTCIRAIGEF